MNKQEVELLSEEVEMLMRERAMLLDVVGAAAMMISHAEAKDLPASVMDAAERLSKALNALSEDTLKDALEAARAKRG